MGDCYVYILSNDHHNVLYVGSTNDLRKRLHHHKRRLIPGFTKKYNVHRLVYFEVLPDMDAARRREKQIKGVTRAKKEALIDRLNPGWDDIFGDLREDGVRWDMGRSEVTRGRSFGSASG